MVLIIAIPTYFCNSIFDSIWDYKIEFHKNTFLLRKTYKLCFVTIDKHKKKYIELLDTLTKYDHKCINFNMCNGEYTPQTLIIYCDNPVVEPIDWAEGDAVVDNNVNNKYKNNNDNDKNKKHNEDDYSVVLLPDPVPDASGRYEVWICPSCNHSNSVLWTEKCVIKNCQYPFQDIPINTQFTQEMPTNPTKIEFQRQQEANINRIKNGNDGHVAAESHNQIRDELKGADNDPFDRKPDKQFKAFSNYPWDADVHEKGQFSLNSMLASCNQELVHKIGYPYTNLYRLPSVSKIYNKSQMDPFLKTSYPVILH